MGSPENPILFSFANTGTSGILLSTNGQFMEPLTSDQGIGLEHAPSFGCTAHWIEIVH